MKALAFEGSNRTIVDKSHFIRFGFRKDAEESGEVWNVIHCETRQLIPQWGWLSKQKMPPVSSRGKYLLLTAPFIERLTPWASVVSLASRAVSAA
jgi:hypothetical protein